MSGPYYTAQIYSVIPLRSSCDDSYLHGLQTPRYIVMHFLCYQMSIYWPNSSIYRHWILAELWTYVYQKHQKMHNRRRGPDLRGINSIEGHWSRRLWVKFHSSYVILVCNFEWMLIGGFAVLRHFRYHAILLTRAIIRQTYKLLTNYTVISLVRASFHAFW